MINIKILMIWVIEDTFLCTYFKNKGYSVIHTGKSGDYGADLILQKNNDRIVVQSKRYKEKVGISAIQQVIGAREYYRANRAICCVDWTSR